MIFYNLASVIDTGNVLEVMDVVPNTSILLEPGVQYEKLSATASERIEKHLQNGKRVAIPKGLGREIYPTDLLVKEAQSDVEFNTVVARSKIHDLFTESLLAGNIIQYYKYFEYNNQLAAAGYFITNDNREEKFIEILETGDEKLISILEEYLTIKDTLNIVSWKLDKLTEFEDEAKKIETEDEAIKNGEKYISMLTEPEIVYPRYDSLPKVKEFLEAGVIEEREIITE